ncbi:MAG: DUF3228 family protein [Candidatus Marinimicrobia bacterium]|nr:DUF3228 family protein [Candidatus Neomarinimicrobiota bacterium]
MKTVAVNRFVTRQVKGSGKSWAEGISFEEIASHAQTQLNSGKFTSGYRDGVVLVDVAYDMLKYFFSPMIRITDDTPLIAEVHRRREFEEPYIRIRASSGTTMKTGRVELILYRHDVLTENNEYDTDADWELIAFNAIPEDIQHMPMGPITMMRNQLELPGGTAAHYSSEQWAESIRFWQQYAMLK